MIFIHGTEKKTTRAEAESKKIMKKVPNGHISSKIPAGPMLNINKPWDDTLEKQHGKCLIFFNL